MATTDNGAIDYRRRIQSRKNQQAVSQPATEAATEAVVAVAEVADTPLEHGELLTAEAATAVLGVPAVSEPPAQPAETAMSRTPQAVREQAKSAVAQLLSVSEAEYTAMMTSLSVADPILYAAVVDEINDARAAETKTA